MNNFVPKDYLSLEDTIVCFMKHMFGDKLVVLSNAERQALFEEAERKKAEESKLEARIAEARRRLAEKKKRAPGNKQSTRTSDKFWNAKFKEPQSEEEKKATDEAKRAAPARLRCKTDPNPGVKIDPKFEKLLAQIIHGMA